MAFVDMDNLMYIFCDKSAYSKVTDNLVVYLVIVISIWLFRVFYI